MYLMVIDMAKKKEKKALTNKLGIDLNTFFDKHVTSSVA